MRKLILLSLLVAGCGREPVVFDTCIPIEDHEKKLLALETAQSIRLDFEEEAGFTMFPWTAAKLEQVATDRIYDAINSLRR